MLTHRADAYRLLDSLGAPAHLLLHLQLVGEAGDMLIQAYQDLGLQFNAALIELGVAVHDVGKIEHPRELTQPGALHELAGQKLLLRNGVQPEVARCCVTHASWQGPGVSLEERTVALADKLWKGKREPELELLVVDEVAQRMRVGRWDVFESLDATFETIAAGGIERLIRSQAA